MHIKRCLMRDLAKCFSHSFLKTNRKTKSLLRLTLQNQPLWNRSSNPVQITKNQRSLWTFFFLQKDPNHFNSASKFNNGQHLNRSKALFVIHITMYVVSFIFWSVSFCLLCRFTTLSFCDVDIFIIVMSSLLQIQTYRFLEISLWSFQVRHKLCLSKSPKRTLSDFSQVHQICHLSLRPLIRLLSLLQLLKLLVRRSTQKL